MDNVLYPPQFHSRITSASKPAYSITISARRKREILLSLGWSVYDGETVVVYTHPEVSNNEPFFLDDAWNAQLLRELGSRYWGSDVS